MIKINKECLIFHRPATAIFIKDHRIGPRNRILKRTSRNIVYNYATDGYNIRRAIANTYTDTVWSASPHRCSDFCTLPINRNFPGCTIESSTDTCGLGTALGDDGSANNRDVPCRALSCTTNARSARTARSCNGTALDNDIATISFDGTADTGTFAG